MKFITHYKTINSPTGRITLMANNLGLCGLDWEESPAEDSRFFGAINEPKNPILIKAEQQLAEYFRGERTQFTLKLSPQGTDFQLRVWKALLSIPFGETRSYGDIAKQLGQSKSARAVGAANGKNPIAIFIPCHRVIGADGSLTGFSGGLEKKRILLRLEQFQTVESFDRPNFSMHHQIEPHHPIV